jgi:hypothetical protein
MEYTLNLEEIPYCQGVWDEKIGDYRDETVDDKISCCLNKCQNYIDFCRQKCQNNNPTKDCYRKCDELMVNCRSVCFNLDLKGEDTRKYNQTYSKSIQNKNNKKDGFSYKSILIIFLLLLFMLVLSLYNK